MPSPVERARAVLDRLSLAEQVGQLFMAGVGADGGSLAALRPGGSRRVGNVMLTGRSRSSHADVARRSRSVRALATTRSGVVLPFVATDQEGGEVQVLQGQGFSDLPSAKVQGSWSEARLRSRAGGWARELRTAGLNVVLAPVADTVPGAAAARTNPPIGAHDRQFGYTTDVVASHVLAFVDGMTSGQVASAVKHFPGLGYVHANTDTSARVVDTRIGRDSEGLQPFRAAVRAGVPLVMVSTATYSRIDPDRPAAFSRAVVTELLRGDIGFSGVVISDDLGAARQVQAWSPGERAVRFVAAGGDIVLTVDPRTVAPMYDAVLARARTDGAFRTKIDAAVLRVLTAKARFGLLHD